MIRKDMVFVGENLSGRDTVIRFIAEAAKRNGLITDQDALVQAVTEREAQVSTSVGHQFAIPHGKTLAVLEPFVAYVNVKEPFEWDSRTKDQIRSVFLIGVPMTDADMTHLKYISGVSKKLINDAFREKLLNCTQREQAFQLLRSINQ